MPQIAELRAFLISACLGALIGLERQWDNQHGGEETRAGLRTFVLWALLGTISAFISKQFVPGFYSVGFGALVLILLAASRRDQPSLGLTTLSSAVMTFFLGSLVYWGDQKLSIILAVSMILVLASKRRVHAWSKNFNDEDVHSGLQFLAITGIILPLAPNHDYGPFAAFNPFKIWLMVVLVTGLGFFGYVATRLLGPRKGLGTMGILGGLTSSTVTTLAFSKQSRDRPELSSGFAMAIILASTILLARVAILVATINLNLLAVLSPGLLAMALPGLAYAAWHWMRKGESTAEAPAFANPMSLRMALQFALLFTTIVFLIRAGAAYLGDTGINLVSFISGLTDMDAIALSLTQLTTTSALALPIAAKAILIGALSNTILKSIFAVSFGTPVLRKTVLLIFAATLLCGGAAVWFM